MCVMDVFFGDQCSVILADCTNSRAYATVLPLSVCTEYIVPKRYVLEQKLLLTAM